jgi:hypothetical protein
MILVHLPRNGTAQFKISVEAIPFSTQQNTSVTYMLQGIRYFGGFCLCLGHAVEQFVQAVRYKPESRGVRFPMVSLEFFIDIILPAAQWLWVGLSL